METAKKELSYFRLKLENYLGEHFPEMLSDKPFITARADEALTSYCDAVRKAFPFPKRKQWQAKCCIEDCTSQSTTRLYLSWRMSLKKNFPIHSPKSSPRYF